MKSLNIDNDKLIQDLLRYLRENKPKKYRATSLVNVFFRSHSADSNHPKYRIILRRLNWLYDNGYIKAHFINHYIAIKWYAE